LISWRDTIHSAESQSTFELLHTPCGIHPSLVAPSSRCTADQSFKYSHWIAASFMRHRVLSRRDNRSLYGRNEAAPDYGAIFCFGLACYE